MFTAESLCSVLLISVLCSGKVIPCWEFLGSFLSLFFPQSSNSSGDRFEFMETVSLLTSKFGGHIDIINMSSS